MLYKMKQRSDIYNSISENMNVNLNVNITDKCVYCTTMNTILFIIAMYYCVLATYALLTSSFYSNTLNDCSTSLLYIFVCMTMIVSVGFVMSNIFYVIEQTNTRLGLCRLFGLLMIAMYGLILMEMTDRCSIENKMNNYNPDLYSIAWVWVNMVTFGLFVLIIITFSCIAYDMSYKEDSFRYYKYKKDDIIRLERERDDCEVC